MTVINPHFIASQGGYSRDRAITVYDRMKATAAVCVNDHEMCRYILTRGGTPILRIRAPDDDDADAKWDAHEYVDTVHTQLSVAEDGIPGAALRGRVHIGNELGSADPPRTARWLEKAIRRATFHKRKAVAANWSVKNPEAFMHPELAKQGVYAAIIENGGEMGYHDGAYIDPKTGDVYRSFEDCVQSGAIGGFLPAMRQYGFRVRVTEFAASKTPNDGWATWIGEDEFAALCRKAAQFYAALSVQVHVYSAFKWDRGTGFEYVDAPSLQASWAETNRIYPVKEPPVTQPDPSKHNWGNRIDGATLRATTGIKVREMPFEKSAEKGLLKDGAVVTYWDNPFQGSSYRWYKVLFEGVERYIAEVSLLHFEPAVPPAPQGRLLTPEAQARIRAHSKAIDDANAAIMAEIDSAPEVAAPNPADTFW